MNFDNQLLVLDNKLARWHLDHLNDYAINSKYTYSQLSDANAIDRDCRFASHLSESEMKELKIDLILQPVFSKFNYTLDILNAYFNHYPLHAYVNRHIDDVKENTVTIIVCCNKYWDETWGGELKIYEEQGPIHKVIDYSPGRIIVFDSKLEHKAMPITPYAKSDRFTLAIKLSIIDESL